MLIEQECIEQRLQRTIVRPGPSFIGGGSNYGVPLHELTRIVFGSDTPRKARATDLRRWRNAMKRFVGHEHGSLGLRIFLCPVRQNQCIFRKAKCPARYSQEKDAAKIRTGGTRAAWTSVNATLPGLLHPISYTRTTALPDYLAC